VDQESSNLHLTGSIEGHEADVGVRESLLASLDLLEDLRSVGASEHGELPHRPVTVVLVSGGGTLETGARAVTDVSVLGIRELEAGGESVADLEREKENEKESE
jgi:hypothetical protein